MDRSLGLVRVALASMFVASTALYGDPLLTEIVYGDDASPVEIQAAFDWATSIEAVCGEVVDVKPVSRHKANTTAKVVFIGTQTSHPLIKKTLEAAGITAPLEPEAYTIKSFAAAKKLVIAGGDDRGVFYGMYRAEKELLGVDPLAYFTEKKPRNCPEFDVGDLAITQRAPAVALRGYLDRHNDLLANWRDQKLKIEFYTWKAMIDALMRLGYNYIDLEDTIGQAAYWQRQHYLDMTAFATDFGLINEIIDYAHKKGMMVQVPLTFGYSFGHIDPEKMCLSQFQNHWLEVARSILKTPLRRADMFVLRPGHPYKNAPYQCPAEDKKGLAPGPLLTKLLLALDKMVKALPGAQGKTLVVDLQSHGAALWSQGSLALPRDMHVLWPDDGAAKVLSHPNRTRGRHLGILLHGGHWQNNVVQNPYPHRIEQTLRAAHQKAVANNILVNGQNFKNFMLNIAAAGEAMWDPVTFSSSAFMERWTAFYFGKQGGQHASESLKYLFKASTKSGGFTALMEQLKAALLAFEADTQTPIDLKSLKEARQFAKRAKDLAHKGSLSLHRDHRALFDDQVSYPAGLLNKAIGLVMIIGEIKNLFAQDRDLDQKGRLAKNLSASFLKELKDLNDMLTKGSRLTKWQEFTNPLHLREASKPPSQGFARARLLKARENLGKVSVKLSHLIK